MIEMKRFMNLNCDQILGEINWVWKHVCTVSQTESHVSMSLMSLKIKVQIQVPYSLVYM